LDHLRRPSYDDRREGTCQNSSPGTSRATATLLPVLDPHFGGKGRGGREAQQSSEGADHLGLPANLDRDAFSLLPLEFHGDRAGDAWAAPAVSLGWSGQLSPLGESYSFLSITSTD
jgi:hypothetical protein